MALSQIQCLDDNHVNPRTHESKPEFLYCEEQRLALEALLRDGREAFAKFLEARGLRGFLSDLERETLTAAAEPFDPDSEVLPRDADDERTPLSLQYWPELSDTSVPQLDLGWPDCDSYRGVTRTSVYSQPPLEGQVHIKEVVRKMIAQAQKVIAVVMDVFTDVDIFRDLLDAGFKRKVSVYILLERTTLPHFLSMCQRAGMHAGHLKHLRVSCTGGAEFYTRQCIKVTGRMGHRFMFIDGDKAVSGSYSFTWMASRLDRNLITVTTGQAVDAFDQLFRFLYLTSRAVDLRKVATEPEPEPDSRPQVASVVAPSAAVARKLHNPKYALVALTNPSPATSAGNDNPKEPKTSEMSKKKEQRRLSVDTPLLHPGLIHLEKAYLIPYLPTWPEPDPPSDVIGFINIRDANKCTQVHLQRSERFEISQAIKFSSPLSKPQQPLPEVATPRLKHDEINKLPPAQNELKAKELVVNTTVTGQSKSEDKTSKQTSPPCSQKSVLHEDKTMSLKDENKLCSNTTTNPDASCETLSVSQDTPPQTSNKSLLSNKERASDKAETVSTTSLKSDFLTPLGKPQDILPEDADMTLESTSAESPVSVERNPTLHLIENRRSRLP
ncbi:protein FAM83G [Nematolebias whitei]|uniref:protein FAM83G n=1 Tax=Nematolebias whitei TaxID=451745 RepID=UPI00189BA3A7|nr:protein FAM83G [Nematolebias whitei]